ncbi:Protein mlp1 [Malassezia cuniculi]|uniref:Protein mlp1 n=1 Tax=Malassezia cuniculi TaxID=948313 RepID=A0AAF0EUB1_9BASI|nr:Protein mlp1 [Malassezia cuniculi]
MADFEARVAALEDEKRKLLVSWQRERDESARKTDNLYARNQTVREQLAATALSLEQSQSAENTLKFRTRALEQELELARNDTEWARRELSREHQVAAESRAELHARLASAEAELEAATHARAAANEQLAKVERALRETQSRHVGVADRVAELGAALASKEHEFAIERDSLKAAAELAEARLQQAEERADELEEMCDGLLEQVGNQTSIVQDEAEADRAALETALAEKEALQEALDRLAAGLGIDTESGSAAERLALLPAVPSQAAVYAAQVQRSGKSFSEVYVELLRAHEELRRERLETSRLEGVLSEVMADLDASAPRLRAQREENEQLRNSLDAANAELEDATERAAAATSSHDQVQAELAGLKREHELVSHQLDDASQQVRALMRELIVLRDPSAAERLEDDGLPVSDDQGDIHRVITEQLVTFRSLSELCAQNSRLLRAVRELGTKMEERDEQSPDAAMDEAAALIERLRDELEQTRDTVEGLRRERDALRAVRPSATPAPPAPAPTDNKLSEQLAGAEARASSAEAAAAAASERTAMLEQTVELRSSELRAVQGQCENLSSRLASREAELRAAEKESAAQQSAVASLRMQIASLESERNLITQHRDALADENTKASLERARLEQLARQSGETQKELESKRAAEEDRLRREVSRLDTERAAAESKFAETREQLATAELRREVEVRQLRERADAATELHVNAREALGVAHTNIRHLECRIDDLNAQLEQAHKLIAMVERQIAANDEARRAAQEPLGATTDMEASGLSRERQLEMELADVRRGRAAAETETIKAQGEAAAAGSARDTAIAALEAKESELSTAKEEHAQALADAESAKETLNTRIEELEAQIAELTASRDEIAASVSAKEAAFAQEKRELEDALAGLNKAETDDAAEQSNAWEEVRRHALATKELESRVRDAETARDHAARETESVRADLARAREEGTRARKAQEIAEAQYNKAALEAQEQLSAHDRTITSLRTQLDELKEQNNQLHAHLESVSAQAANITAAASGQTETETESAEAPAAGDLHQVIRFLRREKEVLELQLELGKQEHSRLQHSVKQAHAAAQAAQAELEAERARSSEPADDTKYAELLSKINELSALREHAATIEEARQAADIRIAALEEQLRAATESQAPHAEQLRTAQADLETAQSQLRVVQEDARRWQTRAQTLLQSSGVQAELSKLETERQEAQARVDEAQSQLESEKSRLTNELHEASQRFERLRSQVHARITQERRAVAEAVEKSNVLQTAKDELEKKQADAEEEATQLKSRIAELEAKVEELEKAEPAAETETGQQADEPMDSSEQPAEQPKEEAPTETCTSAIETEKAQLEEQLRLKTEEAEKHKNFARTFLKQKRTADAQIQEHVATIERLQKQLEGEGHQVCKSEPNEEPKEEPNDTLEASSESLVGSAGDAASQKDEDKIAELKARIAELESQIETANKRIAELEAQLAAAPDAAEFEKLKTELESARAAQNPDLTAALEAKEQELKEHYQSMLQSRYDDGKHEATLRNTIMLKLRDEKIKKLTAEIAELKSENGAEENKETPAAPAASAAQAEPAAAAPQPSAESDTKQTPKGKAGRGGSAAATRGGRGGHTGPKPVPLIKGAGKEVVTSIRGAAAGRGARGGSRGGHASQSKRKRDGEAAQENGNASNAATAKKSRGEGESK